MEQSISAFLKRTLDGLYDPELFGRQLQGGYG